MRGAQSGCASCAWCVPPFRAGTPSWSSPIVASTRALLFRRIVRLGWHPFLRINTGGTFCPLGQKRAVPLRSLVPQPGCVWSGRGIAFQTAPRRLDCTLVACWKPGYKDPWLILTDLAPSACTVSWYGVRTWIEQGFKVLKRGGWQWQRTRMTNPERAERLWLALAVATLWVISIGDALEQDVVQPVIRDLSPRRDARPRPRLVRLFRLGHLGLLAATVLGQPLPLPTRLSSASLPPPQPCLDPTSTPLPSTTYP